MRSRQDPAASAAASDPGLTCARPALALYTHACLLPQPQSVRLMPRTQAPMNSSVFKEHLIGLVPSVHDAPSADLVVMCKFLGAS